MTWAPYSFSDPEISLQTTCSESRVSMLGQVTAVKKRHLNISILSLHFFTENVLPYIAEVLQWKTEHTISIFEIQVLGK